jgi:hypothetical protein
MREDGHKCHDAFLALTSYTKKDLNQQSKLLAHIKEMQQYDGYHNSSYYAAECALYHALCGNVQPCIVATATAYATHPKTKGNVWDNRRAHEKKCWSIVEELNVKV